MTAVDGILFLLAIAAFFGGLAGMILPSLIRLKSRLVAFGIFLSSVIFAGIGGALDKNSQEGFAGVIGLAAIAALLWGAAWLLRQIWRTIRKDMRESSATNAEMLQAEKVRREIDAHRRMAVALKEARPPDRLPPESSTSVSMRTPPAPRAPARQKRPKIEPDRQGRPKAKAGTSVSFTYVDAEGEITDRELRNWSRTSQHIEGYCLERRAVRTFRMDRVIQWGNWE